MKGPRLNWRRELLILCVLGMDLTWLAPWTGLLTGTVQDPAHWVSPLGLALLLLGALWVTRALAASPLTLGVQQLLSGLCALGGGLLLTGAYLYREYPLAGGLWLAAWLADVGRLTGGGPQGLVLLGVALYAWWRGMSLAQDRLGSEAVGFILRLGIVAWLWFYLISLFSPVRAPVAGVFLYFCCGLLAVGLSRVEETRQEWGAVRSPFGGRWLLIMAGSTLVTVELGWAATLVFSRRLVAALWQALGPVGVVLRTLLYWIVQLAFLVLMALMRWLIQALGPDAEQLLTQPAPAATPAPSQPITPTGVPVAVQVVLWASGGLALLAIVGLIVVGLRRPEPEGDRRPEWDAAWDTAGRTAGDGLAARLQRLRARLLDALAGARLPSYSLATVREIYASLCRLAAWKGLPRDDAETPYEYERRLRGSWPDTGRTLASLTEAYVRAHYGERQASGAEMEVLRAEWEALRKRLEEAEPPASA